MRLVDFLKTALAEIEHAMMLLSPDNSEQLLRQFSFMQGQYDALRQLLDKALEGEFGDN